MWDTRYVLLEFVYRKYPVYIVTLVSGTEGDMESNPERNVGRTVAANPLASRISFRRPES